MIRKRDLMLVKFNQRLEYLQRNLGHLESDLLGKRLHRIAIKQPVFITGLARSGTTIMLNLLSKADGVATHRYRDFPFLDIPVTWNWFQDRFSRSSPVSERPHGDRILINSDSPEAFEEPLWQSFFPWVHDPRRCHVMPANQSAPKFEKYFSDHIRKILMLRKGSRYVSKGNYNITRLEYLAQLMPDARFLIPVRDPCTHVHSLVKQHFRFSEYATRTPAVSSYLAAAGHYEFGPQRCPVNTHPKQIGTIEEAWQEGDEYRGYARQWSQLYGYVEQLRNSTSALAERMMVVRFEDLCTNPIGSLDRILSFTGLQDRSGEVRAVAETFTLPTNQTTGIRHNDLEAVQEETADMAVRYGYAHLTSSSEITGRQQDLYESGQQDSIDVSVSLGKKDRAGNDTAGAYH